MLHRRTNEGVIVITQPAHARLSGDLARAWGNEVFGDFAPQAEMCLAADLHDIGFLDWEESPTLNLKTGLPHSFLDLPTKLHLNIWAKGIRQMTQYSRYAALLVSMHFATLAQRHPSLPSSQETQFEKNFLEEQRANQHRLMTSLRNDPQYASSSGNEVLARNRELVSLWDWISLLLCMGLGETQIVNGVPAAKGKCDITLTSLSPGEPSRVKLFPWPFNEASVCLSCEGRRLTQTFREESVMREALSTASTVVVPIELVPE
jgi:hypothetical protein